MENERIVTTYEMSMDGQRMSVSVATTPVLRVRAELLADGGPALWEDFMAELRTEHLGMPPPPGRGPSATERLAVACAEAVAATIS